MKTKCRNLIQFLTIISLLLCAGQPARGALLPTTTSLTSSVNPSCPGSSVTFTATVTRATYPYSPVSGVTVQFETNGVGFGSAVTSSSGIASTAISLNAGTYTVTATNRGNTVYAGSVSTNYLQTVAVTPPVITTQPCSETVSLGSPVRFVVAASGALSYQWQFNGGNITNATNSVYSIASAAAGNASNYQVVVGNPCGSTNSLTATLTVTGVLKWKALTGGAVEGSPAIGANGTVYVTSCDGSLYSFNPANGSTNWSTNLFVYVNNIDWSDAPVPSPAIGADGTVYVAAPGAPATLYAFNTNGAVKWTNDLNNAWDEDFELSTPAIGGDGTIYVGADDYPNHLFAVRSNGVTAWTVPDGVIDDCYSDPAIGTDGTIYFITEHSGNLCAVSRNGCVKWQQPVPFWHGYHAIAVGSDGTIYLVGMTSSEPDDGGNVTNTTSLYAYNPSGSLEWQSVLFVIMDQSYPISPPVIGPGGAIYVGYATNLYNLNQNVGGQTQVLFSTMGDNIITAPAFAADGTIYFGTDAGNLYAVWKSGIQNWVFATGGAINSSPAVGADGTVCFGSDDGHLYAVVGSAPLGNFSWPMFFKNAAHTGCQAGSACPPEPFVDWTFKPSLGSWLYDAAVQNDGKILVAGPGPGAVRLNPDGTLDSSFDASAVFADFVDYILDPLCVAVDSLDRVYIGGDGGSSGQYGRLIRLNSDGTFDANHILNAGDENGYGFIDVISGGGNAIQIVGSSTDFTVGGWFSEIGGVGPNGPGTRY